MAKEDLAEGGGGGLAGEHEGGEPVGVLEVENGPRRGGGRERRGGGGGERRAEGAARGRGGAEREGGRERVDEVRIGGVRAEPERNERGFLLVAARPIQPGGTGGTRGTRGTRGTS